jgi:DNA-binding CsgD family transcriptional regulator
VVPVSSRKFPEPIARVVPVVPPPYRGNARNLSRPHAENPNYRFPVPPRPRRPRRRHPVLMTHDHDIAQTVCTPGELIVYQLTERGLSQRTISLHLNISRSTVRSRLENAYRKIRNAKGEAA